MHWYSAITVLLWVTSTTWWNASRVKSTTEYLFALREKHFLCVMYTGCGWGNSRNKVPSHTPKVFHAKTTPGCFPHKQLAFSAWIDFLRDTGCHFWHQPKNAMEWWSGFYTQCIQRIISASCLYTRADGGVRVCVCVCVGGGGGVIDAVSSVQTVEAKSCKDLTPSLPKPAIFQG